MKQLHYSIQIFLQKLRQSRMYTLLILETYILYIYVQPVIKFSQDVKYPSTPVSYTHLSIVYREKTVQDLSFKFKTAHIVFCIKIFCIFKVLEEKLIL